MGIAHHLRASKRWSTTTRLRQQCYQPMSRIDRALKGWEADKGGPITAEPEIAPSSALNQYAHEETTPQRPQPEPAPSRPFESTQPSRPSSISRPSGDRRRFSDHADI